VVHNLLDDQVSSSNTPFPPIPTSSQTSPSRTTKRSAYAPQPRSDRLPGPNCRRQALPPLAALLPASVTVSSKNADHLRVARLCTSPFVPVQGPHIRAVSESLFGGAHRFFWPGKSTTRGRGAYSPPAHTGAAHAIGVGTSCVRGPNVLRVPPASFQRWLGEAVAELSIGPYLPPEEEGVVMLRFHGLARWATSGWSTASPGWELSKTKRIMCG
jgi:hypothetical protein